MQILLLQTFGRILYVRTHNLHFFKSDNELYKIIFKLLDHAVKNRIKMHYFAVYPSVFDFYCHFQKYILLLILEILRVKIVKHVHLEAIRGYFNKADYT